MEKLIYQYLEENYFPYKEGDDCYRLYKNDNIFDEIYAESSNKIVDDLKIIYGIEYEEVKLFVFIWSVKKFPNIDLSEYWGEYDRWIKYWGDGTNKAGGYYSHVEGSGNSNFSQGVLPLAQRIAARTIGFDMVSVQPLSMPMGLLQYVDFQYRPKQTIKQKVNSVLEKVKIFIRKMEKDIRKYLHITNYNTTFVKD